MTKSVTKSVTKSDAKKKRSVSVSKPAYERLQAYARSRRPPVRISKIVDHMVDSMFADPATLDRVMATICGDPETN